MIQKILIANRGEIAVRVMRTCKEMGIQTVAVYSEVDRTSRHVAYADEAVKIGLASAADSYLNIEKIIDAAKKFKVDAIHPGYGFLSENAEFARRCKEEGIIFIGPSAESIEAMGDKISARKKMIEAKVPVVPGTSEDLKPKDLFRVCRKIGFPVIIKATAVEVVRVCDLFIKRSTCRKLTMLLSLKRWLHSGTILFTSKNILNRPTMWRYSFWVILMVMWCICTTVNVQFSVVIKR